jgi:hypothetical protein
MLAVTLLFVGAVIGRTQLDDGTRFETLDIYIECEQPLAAWQFELDERNDLMRVVGVENGESDAFEGAPYYDLEAVSLGRAERIIVADFSLRGAAELPVGSTRVATVHVQLRGSADPEYDLH